MRNSAFRTVTTKSRGVKSSLTRMTLCRRGRSVLVLTLVFGLLTVSIIAQEYRLPAFGGTGCFAMASLQRRRRAQVSDDIGQIGFFQPGIKTIGHRWLEHPPVARNSAGDGT